MGVAWRQWYLMVLRCELVARIQGRQHGRKAGQMLTFGVPAEELNLPGCAWAGGSGRTWTVVWGSSGQGSAAARQAAQMSAKRSALLKDGQGGAGWFSEPAVAPCVDGRNNRKRQDTEIDAVTPRALPRR